MATSGDTWLTGGGAAASWSCPWRSTGCLEAWLAWLLCSGSSCCWGLSVASGENHACPFSRPFWVPQAATRGQLTYVSEQMAVRTAICLLLCRVGGSIPVIFSYFSEFMPRLRRGAMISALATFWMAGNILAAGAKLQKVKWWNFYKSSTSIIIHCAETVVSVFTMSILMNFKEFCFSRSGLVGDTKNRAIRLSGFGGF